MKDDHNKPVYHKKFSVMTKIKLKIKKNYGDSNEGEKIQSRDYREGQSEDWSVVKELEPLK